jgi:hypothetical protein
VIVLAKKGMKRPSQEENQPVQYREKNKENNAKSVIETKK